MQNWQPVVRMSLAGRLFLTCAQSMVYRWQHCR